MASAFSNLARILGELGGGNNAFTRFSDRVEDPYRANRGALGNILSGQSIPEFARMGGAEPDSPENIREAQLAQLSNLGTPEALEILGKLSPMNQSPEKMKALGYLSSVISQRYGLPTEQINAMLMGGVEPTALGNLLTPETPDLVQTYDPATGQMVYTPKSQAAGKVAAAPVKTDRKIVEQGGIQYYADTGEAVIPAENLPKPVTPIVPSYLPQNVPDPTARFSDKAKAELEFLKQSEDKIKLLEEPLAQEREVVNRLDRFDQLLNVQETGAAQYSPIYLNPNLKEMESIQNEVAPKLREPGSGSSSDIDVKMFKNATVSPTNPVPTNRNIITARKAAAQNKFDQANFFREYQSAYGHTKGAEEAWSEYLNANPIFDKKASKENVILNPDRLSYKDYFQIKNGGITPADAQAELKRRGKL